MSPTPPINPFYGFLAVVAFLGIAFFSYYFLWIIAEVKAIWDEKFNHNENQKENENDDRYP